MMNYLSIDEALDVHTKTIDYSKGGTYGALELGKLESVLANIQNDDYYPSLCDKLTHLFFCACKFHCFEDGNKRIAITLCVKLLIKNNYTLLANKFMQQTENISYFVAAGKIDKDFLHEIIEAIISDNFTDNLNLKLKLYEKIK